MTTQEEIKQTETKERIKESIDPEGYYYDCNNYLNTEKEQRERLCWMCV